jgi:hypothetical protein
VFTARYVLPTTPFFINSNPIRKQKTPLLCVHFNHCVQPVGPSETCNESGGDPQQTVMGVGRVDNSALLSGATPRTHVSSLSFGYLTQRERQRERERPSLKTPPSVYRVSVAKLFHSYTNLSGLQIRLPNEISDDI